MYLFVSNVYVALFGRATLTNFDQHCFAFVSFRKKGFKRQTHDALAVQAGDLVLEVNRVVVSTTTVDRVSRGHDAKISNTVKPLLSGPPIKRTLSRVPKLMSDIPFITNLYSADTSIKRTQTLK